MSLRLLIAEDDASTREFLEAVLKDPAWDIEFASDGEDAIKRCDTRLPDLAVLDIRMPGRSGIEVCQWIKEHSPGRYIPVILLTAAKNLEDKVAGLNSGADDYVTKPFLAAELRARIQALLRVKQLTEQLSAARAALQQSEKKLVALQVAGAAAHELGQPLTSMMLTCEMLPLLHGNSEGLEQAAKELSRNCDRMKEILLKLLTLKEFRTRKYHGELQIVDAEQACSNTNGSDASWCSAKEERP